MYLNIITGQCVCHICGRSWTLQIQNKENPLWDSESKRNGLRRKGREKNKKGKKKKHVGRKRYHKGNRYASKDADASHGLCFSSSWSPWCFWLHLYCCPHQEGYFHSPLLLIFISLICNFFSCVGMLKLLLILLSVFHYFTSYKIVKFQCILVFKFWWVYSVLMGFCVFQEFYKLYGSGWQCVVGSNFGCFFTHKPGTFIYFALGTLNFLIFKGASSWFYHFSNRENERERERERFYTVADDRFCVHGSGCSSVPNQQRFHTVRNIHLWN